MTCALWTADGRRFERVAPAQLDGTPMPDLWQRVERPAGGWNNTGVWPRTIRFRFRRIVNGHAVYREDAE